MNKTKTKLNHTHFCRKISPDVVVIQIEFGKNAIKCLTNFPFSLFFSWSLLTFPSPNIAICYDLSVTSIKWKACRCMARGCTVGCNWAGVYTLSPLTYRMVTSGTLLVDHRPILWFEFDCPLVWLTIKIDLFMSKCWIQFSPVDELILRSFDTNVSFIRDVTIKWLGKLLYQFIGNFITQNHFQLNSTFNKLFLQIIYKYFICYIVFYSPLPQLSILCHLLSLLITFTNLFIYYN